MTDILHSTYPQAYFASLTDYNSGIHHGAWIDLGQDKEDIQREIDDMLADSPTTKLYGYLAEEWAVHDYNNMVNLGEYPSLALLSAVGTALRDCPDPDALLAWIDYYDVLDGVGDARELLDRFHDAYIGKYDSDREFAYDYADMSCLLDGVPEAFAMYFDYDAYARDMLINDAYEHKGFYFWK